MIYGNSIRYYRETVMNVDSMYEMFMVESAEFDTMISNFIVNEAEGF